MGKVTLKRAAELVGKNASTIHRAMKSGRLSYEVGPAGDRLVDVSELERVFGLSPQGQDDGDQPPGPVAAELADLRAELHQARRRIHDLEEDRADLRSERERLLRLLEDQGASVKLLTDQRSSVDEERAELRAERDRLIRAIEEQLRSAQREPVRTFPGNWRWVTAALLIAAVIGALALWQFKPDLGGSPAAPRIEYRPAE